MESRKRRQLSVGAERPAGPPGARDGLTELASRGGSSIRRLLKVDSKC
jgi:hypothetical protein